MFVKSVLVAAAFALAATAAYQPELKCSYGAPQCCKAVEDTKYLDHGMMTESSGWPGPGLPTNLIGFACMDMPMDGMGCHDGGMHTPAVCCDMKKGLLSFGCTPAKPAY